MLDRVPSTACVRTTRPRSLHDRNRGREDLLEEPGYGGDARPSVRPYGVDGAAEGRDAFIVAVLVAERIRAGDRLVRRRGRDLDVCAERDAAVRRAGVVDVRAQMSRVVPRVVEAHADRAIARIHGEPLV